MQGSSSGVSLILIERCPLCLSSRHLALRGSPVHSLHTLCSVALKGVTLVMTELSC